MLVNVSLSSANTVFGLSNIALIVGGTLVLTGTVGVFWSGNIRDRYADGRAQENEAKTATAVAESATANAESAKANERNTALKLELEKERVERLRLAQRVVPRTLSEKQRDKLISGLRSQKWTKAEVIWHGDGEPEAYARQFASAFEAAGIRTDVHTLRPFMPSAWGLMIVVSENDSSSRLKAVFDAATIKADLAETNDTLGKKDHPTVVVGWREDQRQ